MRLFKFFAVLMIALIMASSQASAQIPGWQGTSGTPAVFLLEVAKGNIPGHSLVHKFGHGAVGTSFVPVTSSLVYTTPVAAIALEVISNDADDTAAGSGAQEVTIIGLTLDGTEISQVVELNGTTAVPIPTSLFRLYRWYVSRSGVYASPGAGSHEGILTIRVASAGATWSTILFAPFPHGQSQIGWYTIPAGHRGYLLSQFIKVDSVKVADILMLHRSNADDVATPFAGAFRLISEFTGIAGNGVVLQPLSPTNGFVEFTDIGFVAKVASATADVSVDFELLLIKDGY
jgi:hypothetical protein